MNHDTQRFQERLAEFRLMDDKRRSTVCEAMQISQKTHLRLLAEIRKETGTLTKAERFREIIVMVRDWIGDSDPKKLSLMAAAKALDISTNQAARARDAIVRERLQAVAEVQAVADPRPEPKPKPSVRRPHRWHDGLTLRWWPVPAGKRRVRLVVTEANEFDFVQVAKSGG